MSSNISRHFLSCPYLIISSLITCVVEPWSVNKCEITYWPPAAMRCAEFSVCKDDPGDSSATRSNNLRFINPDHSGSHFPIRCILMLWLDLSHRALGLLARRKLQPDDRPELMWMLPYGRRERYGLSLTAPHTWRHWMESVHEGSCHLKMWSLTCHRSCSDNLKSAVCLYITGWNQCTKVPVTWRCEASHATGPVVTAWSLQSVYTSLDGINARRFLSPVDVKPHMPQLLQWDP
jgi:hypothetical protein